LPILGAIYPSVEREQYVLHQMASAFMENYEWWRSL
jgi:hypothetical protein